MATKCKTLKYITNMSWMHLSTIYIYILNKQNNEEQTNLTLTARGSTSVDDALFPAQ